MLDLYTNIKKNRLRLGLTQGELADKMGYADKSMIAKIEKGAVDLTHSKIQAFARIFDIAPGELMGWNIMTHLYSGRASEYFNGPMYVPSEQNEFNSSNSVTINVLGRVAAGIPIEAVEDIIDTEEITEELAKTGEFFGLQIHGDSMEPKISDGDIVIVKHQDDAESGDIIIATVNGNEATCKRLRKYRDGIELISSNPAYAPMFFSNQDIIDKPIRILGKVIELRAKF